MYSDSDRYSDRFDLLFKIVLSMYCAGQAGTHFQSDLVDSWFHEIEHEFQQIKCINCGRGGGTKTYEPRPPRW